MIDFWAATSIQPEFVRKATGLSIRGKVSHQACDNPESEFYN